DIFRIGRIPIELQKKLRISLVLCGNISKSLPHCTARDFVDTGLMVTGGWSAGLRKELTVPAAPAGIRRAEVGPGWAHAVGSARGRGVNVACPPWKLSYRRPPGHRSARRVAAVTVPFGPHRSLPETQD